MKAWQLQGDRFGLFLDHIFNPEGLKIDDANSMIIVRQNTEVPKAKIFEGFKVWHKEEFGKEYDIGRYRFYREMERRGLKETRPSGGERCYQLCQVLEKVGATF
jgi:hypothetical protein